MVSAVRPCKKDTPPSSLVTLNDPEAKLGCWEREATVSQTLTRVAHMVLRRCQIAQYKFLSLLLIAARCAGRAGLHLGGAACSTIAPTIGQCKFISCKKEERKQVEQGAFFSYTHLRCILKALISLSPAFRPGDSHYTGTKDAALA